MRAAIPNGPPASRRHLAHERSHDQPGESVSNRGRCERDIGDTLVITLMAVTACGLSRERLLDPGSWRHSDMSMTNVTKQVDCILCVFFLQVGIVERPEGMHWCGDLQGVVCAAAL